MYKKNTLKLSIITVCFNSEESIEKTMNSILNQTIPIYEYILIDGKSTDNTYHKILSYRDKFEKKKILFKCISEPDKGISDAFNKGIRLATGNLIGLINSDDELCFDACKKIGSIFDDINYDVYYGNSVWRDETANLSYIKRPDHDLRKLLYYMVLIHPSVFVSPRAYKEVGEFDVTYKYCMDKELLYRLFLNKKSFCYLDETLTVYKAGGVSDIQAKEVFREGSRMALAYGEPYYKVKYIEIRKQIKSLISKKMKKCKIYKILKSHY